MRDWEKISGFLYRAGNLVIKLVGGLIFLGLTWYAMRYTYYMCPGGSEFPIIERDSMWKNILAAGIAAVLLATFLFAEERADIRKQQWIGRFMTAAAMLWVGGISIWWILSADRPPVGDQAFVYGGASYFLSGDYGFLHKGAYMGMHPHQLVLTALCELLFVFAGPSNYFAIEVWCVAMAVGTVYVGYRLVLELTDHMAVAVGYDLLMMGCLPLIFYTSWCYGDIPSIFCSLTAAWMLIAYSKHGKIKHLLFLVAAVTLALMFRKHSLILLVALCIAAVLYALKHQDMKIVLAAFMAVVLFEASYQGIFKMYEIRSGVEHEEGIPFNCWIAMGLQETWGTYYGWYNDFPKSLYLQMEFDEEQTKMAAAQEIQDRLEIFQNDPDYAGLFFKEKILSQWNEPLYQALFFNSLQAYGQRADETSLAYKIGGVHYGKMLKLSNLWQFIVFFGMLCYLIFAVKKDSNILQHVLVVTMIGGFFFSLLYEAKARYIFPYYVMMFPFAVYGYQQMLEWAMRLYRGVRREPAEEPEEEVEQDEQTA